MVEQKRMKMVEGRGRFSEGKGGEWRWWVRGVGEWVGVFLRW